MALDPAIAVAGLLVGFTVGLTGMGGGALATPLLILVFKVPALVAVSSDLVASLVMKPFGGGVHLRQGTVRKDLVAWLAIGSVLAAFAGVFVLRLVGNDVQPMLKRALGLALLASAGSIVLRSRIQRLRDQGVEPPPARLRRAPTLAVGVIGGLVVGMTSVGSGSLVIIMLLALYPGLKLAELVGTDLVQAVPWWPRPRWPTSCSARSTSGSARRCSWAGFPVSWPAPACRHAPPTGWCGPPIVAVLAVSGLKLI